MTMTRNRCRAKKSVLIRYPVLSLCVLNLLGVVTSVAFLFGHWWLTIIIYACVAVGSVAFIAWIVRRNTDQE
jgi:hypothetical protein